MAAPILGGFLAIFIAFGTIYPASAQNGEGQSPTASRSHSIHDEVISNNEALLRSKGTILLHFGNDVSDQDIRVISGGLDLAGYRHETYRGGPREHMQLCINEKCGKNDFSIDQAHGLLLIVLDKVAPNFKKK